MTDRKPGHKYYVTTEGETEGWYLDWLEEKINAQRTSGRIKITHYPAKSPADLYGKVKRMSILEKTRVWHWMDTETASEENKKRFCSMLDAMRNKKELSKDVEFALGYSSLSFEVWMLLHKVDRPRTVTKQEQYVDQINKAFSTSFESLQEYKTKEGFKKILSKLTLEDVRQAVGRAEEIERLRVANGEAPREYKRFFFRWEDPANSVGVCIKEILQDNGLWEAKP